MTAQSDGDAELERPRTDMAAVFREKIWLKEAIETGALDRMMETHPPAGSDGVMWTTWESDDD